ncbi:MAG: hypothetical protein N2506_04865 [Dehalococcoidales bacterium]|nr:hypothetical protein [Dehalococcoidales bacterium]
MEDKDREKTLKTLQEEIKLLKGEIKESLASVRDYLLNMELPSPVVVEDLADDGKPPTSPAPGRPEDKKAAPVEENEPELEIADDETFTLDDITEPAEEKVEEIPQSEVEEVPAEEEEEEEAEPEDDEEEEPAEEPELPLKENPMGLEKLAPENITTPRVNMLANLLSWVARAKKEVGYERLPILLEIYGISGHLSPEMKETILHLAEITGDSVDTENNADVWSQVLLSLHGILTGGDAPRHPIIPSSLLARENAAPPQGKPEEPAGEQPENEKEEAKESSTPFKLKLVFPNGDGKEKEFCINLTPDTEGNSGNHKKQKGNNSERKPRR